MADDINNDKDLTLQEYLSLAYLYLIVVGLVTDVIYYNAIGINILNYSSFLDILITPINLLTSNYIMLFSLIVVWIMLYFFSDFLFKKQDILQPTKLQKNRRLLTIFAMFTFGFYTGVGLGMSVSVAEKIKTQKLKVTTNITFNNGKNLNVSVVGQNSAFIFYVVENTSEVIATPIANTIWQIKKIKSK